jgi:hypothetical protein
MTGLYPRERVEAVLQPLAIPTIHRVLLKAFLPEPLSVQAAPSRFCDGHSYSVLYAAGDLATSFAEVLVRDRFVQRNERVIPYGDVRIRAWLEIDLPTANPLRMADLRGSGCLTLGAPTDAAHARNHSAGRALSRALYEQHSDIDGIWYESRLTGGECFAIFDRAFHVLIPGRYGDLVRHPELPSILKTHGITLEVVQEYTD